MNPSSPYLDGNRDEAKERAAQALTDAQLREKAAEESLTPEEMEQYCIRILRLPKDRAEELAYFDGDAE